MPDDQQPSQEPQQHEAQQEQQGAEPSATWESLFEGEDPAKVRQALDDSRKWEQRAKTNFQKAQQFDEHVESQKTEQQRSADALATAQRERDEAATALSRYRVATAQGVPADLVDLVTGDDEDAMTATAQRLMQHVTRPQAPSYDGGARTSAPSERSMSDLIRQATGRT